MWRIRNFIQFLRDLVYWIPKIWQDRDWDPMFLYQLMRWKIERMAKHMTDMSRHIGWEKDVKAMRVCIELLKRCEADDIYDEMYGIFKKPKCDPCVKEFRRERKWLDAKKKADKTYLFQLLDKKADRWWT